MITVKPLKGLKSVWALNAFHTLVWGLAAQQAVLGQDIETTTAKFEALPLDKKEQQIRHALQIVNLTAEDMLNLLEFAKDQNGIPYSQKKLEDLPPQELMDAMLAVCMELAKIKPQICPEELKKNCPAGA